MSVNRLVRRVGQVLIGAMFVKLGGDAARQPGPRVEAAADLGLPRPDLAVRLNGAAMVAGGCALILGVLPRAASAGLAAALLPTTVAGHPFWRHEGPARNQHIIQVAKNGALIGGLLVIASEPPSPPAP